MSHPRARPDPDLLEGRHALVQSLGSSPVFESQDEAWEHVGLCSWRVSLEEFTIPPVSSICVTLNTGGPLKYDGGPDVGSGHCIPGHVCLIAPDSRPHFEPGGLLSGLSVHLSARRLEEMVGDDEKPTACIPRTRLGFDDPFLWGAAHALVDEAEDPSERGSLAADVIGDAISLRLWRLAVRPSERRNGPTLSGRSLGAIRDRIEASLDTGVSLPELAADARMSRHQFRRAFQKATGMSPHRYLTARRIERAKILLRRVDVPLVDVALACGFASQSHFCDRFRSVVGISPGQYRRSSV